MLSFIGLSWVFFTLNMVPSVFVVLLSSSSAAADYSRKRAQTMSILDAESGSEIENLETKGELDEEKDEVHPTHTPTNGALGDELLNLCSNERDRTRNMLWSSFVVFGSNNGLSRLWDHACFT